MFAKSLKTKLIASFYELTSDAHALPASAKSALTFNRETIITCFGTVYVANSGGNVNETLHDVDEDDDDDDDDDDDYADDDNDESENNETNSSCVSATSSTSTLPTTSASSLCALAEQHDNGATDHDHRALLNQIQSLIFLSYRRGFPRLQQTTSSAKSAPSLAITSDAGFGCMMRSTQMMVARALTCFFLSRDWRLEAHDLANQHSLYQHILHLFNDNPSAECVFSLHNLLANDSNICPGDWLGPSSVARLFSYQINRHIVSTNLNCYVIKDSLLCIEEIKDLCYKRTEAAQRFHPSAAATSSSSSTFHNALIILFPTRLGMKQSIGIAGGRLRQSLYFFATVAESSPTSSSSSSCSSSSLTSPLSSSLSLLYLDPHIVQPALKIDEQFNAATFRVRRVHRALLQSLDPSMLFGFYINDEEDFNDFLASLRLLISNNPFLTVVESVAQKKELLGIA